MPRIILVSLLWGVFTVAGSVPARAQGRILEPEVRVRGFVDVGGEAFVASKTFDAILGDAFGTFVGGGGQVGWRWLEFEVSASRFRETGERVFVTSGRVFRLGIPTTITLRPIEVTGAFRFPRLWRLVPYAGGGAGRLRYQETSQFAEEAENVRFTRTSYHIVGGAEVRVWRWIGAAAEVRYRSVRDAIGQAGVSHEFHEDDLGGTEVRVKIIAGR